MKPTTISIGDNRVEILKKLGEGSYGSVYLIHFNGSRKAIKVISSKSYEGIKSPTEVDIMTRLKHPNIIRAEGIMVGINDRVTMGLIMGLASGDLYHMMTQTSFGLTNRIKTLFDITNGLDFMHKNNFLHLDLKPMNVLIFEKPLTAKLTDFGLAQIMENGSYTTHRAELVTITHRPPEVIPGYDIYTYTRATDVWSLGIIFLQVLSYGKRIFTDNRTKAVLRTRKKYFFPNSLRHTLNTFLVDLPKSVKSDAIELITGMLAFNPANRLSASDILKSPIFKNMKLSDGTVIYNRPNRPLQCNPIYYHGFDLMFRSATQLNIKTATFFLAADIYQRSLSYSYKLTGDMDKDWPNVATQSQTSLFMAVKMLEPNPPDINLLVKLAHNAITYNDIVKAEAALIQLFNGMLYYPNLFSESNGRIRLNFAFDLLRNCHIYYRIDLEEWKRDGIRKPEPYFDKYIPFNDFIKGLDYYKTAATEYPDSYLQRYYNQDINLVK